MQNQSERTQILITATAARTTEVGRQIMQARLEAAIVAALAYAPHDLRDLDVAVESGAERHRDDMIPEPLPARD